MAAAMIFSVAPDALAEPVDASRIVSIGGAVTEILYALGREKAVVGIDTTSLYPARAAAEKPSVGYMRQLSAEGVLGLQPSLILAIEGSGPKETLSVLEAAHVPIIVVPDSFSGEGIIEKTRVIAQAAGAPERGQCIIEQVRADLDALRRLETGIEKPRRVLFVLSFVNGRAMASGAKTAADGIIRLAGAINAITEYEGYRPISDEAVVAAKPDVIMTMERAGPATVTPDTVFAHPAFQATPAAANRAFVSMEGLYLLGFGPAQRACGARRRCFALSRSEIEATAVGAAKGRHRCVRRMIGEPALSAVPRKADGWWRTQHTTAILMSSLLLALLGTSLVAAAIGAAGIPLVRLPAAFGLWSNDADPTTLARDQLVLWSVRLPRIVITIFIGALLATSGTIMQGLFRNPLADPALVGVSSGGALAAAASIVIGDRLLTGSHMPFELLPAAAISRFVGDDVDSASHCNPREPHLHRHLPARRARHCGTRQCRHWVAGLCG